ncbi:N-acetylneuraminate synthase [Gammaproteobacteria bacterium]|nr:N-acetylneuraminate synthase [Gammaproteobacteria bacterium]
MSILIIAEAGVNHNANLELCYKLVDAAVDSGADIVKFQTALPEEVVSKFADKADYQKESTGAEESQLEMTKRIHLDFDAFYKISSYCEDKNIEFLTTSFGPYSTKFIAKLGMQRYKIPSGEVTNLEYLEQIAVLGKPVILSTGMCNLGEIESAVAVLLANGLERSQLTILHCNTEYPTPFEDVNLRAMISMRESFKTDIGYSDHTLGIVVPIAAAALGATVIEKHFTLSREMEGPDHKASLEPHELKEMVDSIRLVEAALGSGIKAPSPSEAKNINVARKSLVAGREIKKGELFTKDNLVSKRPGTGISPMNIDTVINRVASRDFGADEVIEY